ncbi:hypothetical protein K523DRAFT_403293, partial [Schizophyllum commune Tattone D]
MREPLAWPSAATAVIEAHHPLQRRLVRIGRTQICVHSSGRYRTACGRHRHTSSGSHTVCRW